MLKLFFCGTPEFAIPALKSLAEFGVIQVSLILTQPDRPKGRGAKVKSSSVKILADTLKIPTIQPQSLRGLKLSDEKKLSGGEDGVATSFNQFGPFDFGVVVAYGNLIPPAILNLPKYGCLNIHPSILPRWRGAAPIQRSIQAGDKKTAIAIMKLDKGLDTGEVYISEEYEIKNHHTSGSLSFECAQIGARLLLENIFKIASGEINGIPQIEDGLTYAKKWEVEESNINWNESAEKIFNLVRASDPEPGAKAKLSDAINGSIVIKLFTPEIIKSGSKEMTSGTVVEVTKNLLIVRCGDGGCVAFSELQFEGRKRLPVREALNGRKISVGERFNPL